MLNISDNKTGGEDFHKYKAINLVEGKRSSKILMRMIIIFLLSGLVVLCLPWTQHIRSKGNVTTLRPDQRPQEVHAVVGGRINKWYVKEGDLVFKGDTLAYISDVKSDYFDPELLTRTKEQLIFKEESVRSYEGKLAVLNEQLIVVERQRKLKLEQARIKLKQTILKVQRDSLNHIAASLKYKTSKKQFTRIETLYRDGLKPLSTLENYRIKQREAEAYEIEAVNKLKMSRNTLLDKQLEYKNTAAKFENQTIKIQSEQYTILSKKLQAEVERSKLKNTLANYKARSDYYYILAPQTGYISRTNQVGIGETIKEGKSLLSIMPKEYQLAVELFVDPIDLPLLQVGHPVRIQFDGWPAVVFSGWPGITHGTYGGKVYAIEQYIGKNGKYRILVEPDENENPWPIALRFGGGTSNLILLNDVQVWYELWRKINGFPADFYKLGSTKDQSGK